MAGEDRADERSEKVEEDDTSEVRPESLDDEYEEEMTVVMPESLDDDDDLIDEVPTDRDIQAPTDRVVTPSLEDLEIEESPDLDAPTDVEIPARGVGLRNSLNEGTVPSHTVEVSQEELEGLGRKPQPLAAAPGELGGGLPGPGERQATRSFAPTSSFSEPPTPLLDEDLDHDREDTEEVFVILPEQLDGEIPVVDTETVDEDDYEGPTQMVDEFDPDGDYSESPTESADDYDGATEIAADGDYDGPTEMVDPEELDQLTSDLDDASLAGEEYDDEFDFGEESFEDGAAPGRGKLLAVLAAVALVAGTTGYFVWSGLSSGPEVVAQSGTVTTTETPTPTIDPRQQLLERVDLAVLRGFEVEESE